jgi:hypothetical protein
MCPGRTLLGVVGANGFERSTSRSRTRVVKIHKSFRWCRIQPKSTSSPCPSSEPKLNLRKLGLRTAILGVETVHQGDRRIVAKSWPSKDTSFFRTMFGATGIEPKQYVLNLADSMPLARVTRSNPRYQYANCKWRCRRRILTRRD